MRVFLLLLVVGAGHGASVEGVAVNAATKAPVPKALVTLHNSEKGFAYAAVADDAGRFRFPTVDAASGYFVTAQATGFTQLGAPHAKVFAVAEDQNVTGITAQIMPGGAISGKLVDANDEPVPGAEIMLMQYGYSTGKRMLLPAQTQAADDRGEYRFGLLAPGRYYVLANPPIRPPDPPGRTHRTGADLDYAPAYYPGAREITGASPIDLAPGGESSGINFRLQKIRLFHIRGKVAGFQASANTPAPIFTSHCEPGPNASHTMVAPDGTFDVPHIAPGTYCVSAQVFHARARETVAVADRDLENVTLTLSPYFEVKGSVAVEGAPLDDFKNPGIRLADVDTDREDFGAGPVEPDGAFRMAGAHPGNYVLRQINTPPNSYLKSVSVNGREVTDGRINLTSSGDTLRLLFATDVGQVNGSLGATEDAGGITVVIAPAEPSLGRDRVHTALTDSSGKFTLPGIAPGDYKVFAFEEIDVNSMASPEYRQVFESLAATVTVHPSGHETADVKLITAAQAAGALKKLR